MAAAGPEEPPLTHLPYRLSTTYPLIIAFSHLFYHSSHILYRPETKVAARAGFSKRNVNTLIPLVCQSNRRYFSTNNEPLPRVSLRPLPSKSKATSNHPVLIIREKSYWANAAQSLPIQLFAVYLIFYAQFNRWNEAHKFFNRYIRLSRTEGREALKDLAREISFGLKAIK